MNFKKKERASIALDLTPLIDVIFLLLLFLMITSSFVKKSKIIVSLPNAKNADQIKKYKNIEIVIDSKNRIYILGKYVRSSKLYLTMKRLVPNAGEIEARIAADENVRHKIVVFVMDQVKSLGIEKISIISNSKR